METKPHFNRKYSLNECYFENIDSEDKAYFLGLLYADGSLNPNNSTIRIMLQERDIDILKKFQSCINSNRPMRYIITPKSHQQNCYSVDTSSGKMMIDLQKQGCFINKTYILKFPTEGQVPNNLIHHFIRGYFDGDGCINLHTKSSTFSIIGTLDFLIELQKIIIRECGLNFTKIPPKHKTNNIICYLRYSGNVSNFKIREFLYKDATIYLQRKKDKFDKIVPKKKVRQSNC